MVIPHVIRKSPGSGWIFPKQSEYFQIFKHYLNVMKEEGIYNRHIVSYYGHKDVTRRVCPNHSGEPIGLEKAASLLGIFIFGAALSVTVLM